MNKSEMILAWLILTIVKASEVCLNTDGIEACERDCGSELSSCLFECNNDSVCMSDCNRGHAKCVGGCPCQAAECLTGCPCKNKYRSTFRVNIRGFRCRRKT